MPVPTPRRGAEQNCLTYINLNMVRAGVVSHPRAWRWCSHDELLGERKRYRILNIDRLCESLGGVSERQLRRWYADTVEQRIAQGQMQREPIWTDSLAVGSEGFVEDATRRYNHRWTFDIAQRQVSGEDAWCVREPSIPYAALSPVGNET